MLIKRGSGSTTPFFFAFFTMKLGKNEIFGVFGGSRCVGGHIYIYMTEANMEHPTAGRRRRHKSPPTLRAPIALPVPRLVVW